MTDLDPLSPRPARPRADEAGISGMPFVPPPEPETELHRWRGTRYVETCECCERPWPPIIVCWLCGATRPEHDRRQARARREIERRRGKIEKRCPVCAGTGRLTDDQGVSAFFPCTRCKGWGRVWRARPRRKAKR